MTTIDKLPERLNTITRAILHVLPFSAIPISKARLFRRWFPVPPKQITRVNNAKEICGYISGPESTLGGAKQEQPLFPCNLIEYAVSKRRENLIISTYYEYSDEVVELQNTIVNAFDECEKWLKKKNTTKDEIEEHSYNDNYQALSEYNETLLEEDNVLEYRVSQINSVHRDRRNTNIPGTSIRFASSPRGTTMKFSESQSLFEALAKFALIYCKLEYAWYCETEVHNRKALYIVEACINGVTMTSDGLTRQSRAAMPGKKLLAFNTFRHLAELLDNLYKLARQIQEGKSLRETNYRLPREAYTGKVREDKLTINPQDKAQSKIDTCFARSRRTLPVTTKNALSIHRQKLPILKEEKNSISINNEEKIEDDREVNMQIYLKKFLNYDGKLMSRVVPHPNSDKDKQTKIDRKMASLLNETRSNENSKIVNLDKQESSVMSEKSSAQILENSKTTNSNISRNSSNIKNYQSIHSLEKIKNDSCPRQQFIDHKEQGSPLEIYITQVRCKTEKNSVHRRNTQIYDNLNSSRTSVKQNDTESINKSSKSVGIDKNNLKEYISERNINFIDKSDTCPGIKEVNLKTSCDSVIHFNLESVDIKSEPHISLNDYDFSECNKSNITTSDVELNKLPQKNIENNINSIDIDDQISTPSNSHLIYNSDEGLVSQTDDIITSIKNLSIINSSDSQENLKHLKIGSDSPMIGSFSDEPIPPSTNLSWIKGDMKEYNLPLTKPIRLPQCDYRTIPTAAYLVIMKFNRELNRNIEYRGTWAELFKYKDDIYEISEICSLPGFCYYPRSTDLQDFVEETMISDETPSEVLDDETNEEVRIGMKYLCNGEDGCTLEVMLATQFAVYEYNQGVWDHLEQAAGILMWYYITMIICLSRIRKKLISTPAQLIMYADSSEKCLAEYINRFLASKINMQKLLSHVPLVASI